MLCGFLNPPRQMVTPSIQWLRNVSLMSWKMKPKQPEPELLRGKERQDPNCTDHLQTAGAPVHVI